MTDISYDAISNRVGAIIIKGDSMLMVRDDQFEYLYTVGGRVEEGESDIDAINREIYEETHMHLEVERLGYVSEIVFRSIDLETKGITILEKGRYYFVRVDENFVLDSVDFVDGNRVRHLVWVSMDTKEKMHPKYLRDELRHIRDEVKYISLDEREK